ncbi:MAG: hypothetical protein C0623_03510 [Desulfuromonas sp.]|nr:MAG: hypothetical protein C0623_03510 [Desulfuromonas sp.]
MDLTKSTQSPLAISLLQALPHPAMLINQSREILAANKLALEAGAVVGQFCWQTFGQASFLTEEHQQKLDNGEAAGVHCSFCRADPSLENLCEENDPRVKVFESIVDTYWVAINEEIYLHYAIDVTEQVEAHVARDAAEERLWKSQLLLNETSKIGKVGGWELNIDTGENRWTEEVHRIHEVSLDYEPTLEDGINFYSVASKPVIAEAVQRAIENNEPYDLELEIVTAKGNLRNVRAIGTPDLENRRLYGFFQDITEKKKLQDAQLRSSQLSALGEVAAGVAHEINNPINGVINYAQLLINKNDVDDKSNQILEKIIKEGSRISNIVENLLNFARKDRGLFSYQDLIDIVIEPINLHSQLCKNDGIHIEVEVPDDLPQIYGNQMQLEQVVLNLLSNARYALNKKFPEPSAEKVIVIAATPSSSNRGDFVQLSVKDTGCGIPKDHLDKIFNPFYTTKETGVGTGLGMSVSHDILEKHGATITVDSEVNTFTLVTVTFPVNTREQEARN